MSKLNDSQYLLKEQYQDAEKLNARIRLHVEFSTNKYGWLPWVFDHYNLPEECRILELGCGQGDLWRENIERIPTGWEVTLSDFSPGMLAQARQNLEGQPHPFTFEVIDAQSIPYDDDHFDAVIANHCIYHFPDRSKAFSEIRRTLKAGSYLYATTIGRAHLQGMAELASKFEHPIENLFNTDNNPFTLENGAPQLREWFADIELDRYPDSLDVTEAAPLVDFIISSVRFSLDETRHAEFLTFVERELTASGGVIRIKKDSGIFKARKPALQHES